MALIHVPRPSKSAANQGRPVSDLLKMQILHLHEVEKKFPPRMHSGIYINDIKTEGQAAEYIRHVTAVLHPQGAPAKKKMKVVKKAKPGRVKEIAAAAGKKKAKKKSAPKKSSHRKKRK